MIDLPKILEEINQQPQWRSDADTDADYYDSNQLSSETLTLMQERGIAPVVTNLIKPTIDVVLGMEAKSRSDWKVTAESEEWEDVAAAQSARLHRAEKDTKADQACSDAYAAMVKTGIGWVEVARETNPFKPRYRVKYIHRREMFWDWLAQEPDLSDARYMVRRKWYDKDRVQAAFPDKEELLEQIVGQWNQFDLLLQTGQGTGLARDYAIARASTIEEWEWLDTYRSRVLVYEVWYKVYGVGYVLALPNGRVVEFNRDDTRHCAAVAAGIVKPMRTQLEKLRQSFWVGPHCLLDRPSPYPHNHYPYVPFIGFREDLTGVPYGLIRLMRPSQDEVNARRSKQMWYLAARRVIADADAVLDHNRAAAEVSRADAYIKLNPNRRKNSRFEILDGGNLAKEQFEVMREAMDNIQRTAGIYHAMLGSARGVHSGKGINALVEQGTTALGEMNDNYRSARERVGELLLSLCIEDMAREESVEIVVESKGGDARTVVINEPAVDEFGEKYLKNDVTKAMTHIALEETPSTPTYRQQVVMEMLEVTSRMDPEVRAVFLPFIIEASDLPHKREVAKLLKAKLGYPDENGMEIPPQVQEKIQQLQQQLEAVTQEAQRLASQNKADEKEIEVLRFRAKELAAAAENMRSQVKMAEARAAAEGSKLKMLEAEEAGRKSMIADIIRGRIPVESVGGVAG